MENTIYQNKDGHRVARETGKTPNGNEIGGFWVLRDSKGNWLGYSQYRWDLMQMDGNWKEI